MKEARKFLKKMMLFSMMIGGIVVILLLWVTQLYNQKFRTSYQYAVNIKYQNLINTTSPKVILIGGSSLTFGMNRQIMEKETGLPIVNLGLHYGFGLYFSTELAKANITEGDIVVLAYEPGLYASNEAVAELIVTGIDNHIGLYQYITNKNIEKVMKYIPTYVFKKLDESRQEVTGVYSMSSFNEKGDLIFDRPSCILPNELAKEYLEVDLKTIELDLEIVNYINDFYEYCKKKGADVIITFSPVLDERMLSTNQEINEFEEKLKSSLLPKIISNFKDYVYPREYMYDTIFHCNNLGEKIRSEKLASDINAYLQSKNHE